MKSFLVIYYQSGMPRAEIIPHRIESLDVANLRDPLAVRLIVPSPEAQCYEVEIRLPLGQRAG